MSHMPSPDTIIFEILCNHQATAHNPIPITDVARLSRLDLPRFEAALEGLIQQELVSRQAMPGAAPSVGLTASGRELCSQQLKTCALPTNGG